MLNHTERKALQRRMPYPPPAPLPTDYSVRIPNTAAEVREAFGSLPGVKTRMLQRLCSYYQERATATEAELSEAREEIRKLRTALRNAHEANEALYDWTGGIRR